MKANTKLTKERVVLARRQILFFEQEAKVVPAPPSSINPLFLKAHRHEFTQVLSVQPN